MNDAVAYLRYGLVIPTRNAGARWEEVLSAIASQTLNLAEKVVVDSDSTDGTPQLAEKFGFRVLSWSAHEFDHGATRQAAVDLLGDVDVAILLTQDAVPGDARAFAELVRPFEDPVIAATYGRQKPHEDATVLASLPREFNYPRHSVRKRLSAREQLGIKTCFMSDAFSAYRLSALDAVGGFEGGYILGEDVLAAAKFLLQGWEIEYAGNAEVRHSHNYSVLEEFRRNFDNGVFYEQAEWIFREFGSADGEGIRYAQYEVWGVLKRNPILVPRSLLRSLAKYVGFKLGGNYRRLPDHIRRLCSGSGYYWPRKVRER